MSKILNIKRSERDEKDFILELLVGVDNLKDKSFCDYRNDLLDVRNQGELGTCFAQSAACMKEWQEKKDYGLNEYLSPQFFYNNRNYWNNEIQDGDDINEDYGMTGRDVMRILKDVGICKESEYPYFKLQKANEIPPEIYESASKHKIKNYARIFSMEGLKHSLLENGPCLIAFPVYNYGKHMWFQNAGDEESGGHAMTVVGFDDKKKHFIIRNSWGSNWQDKGYCYYPYEHWGSHWEIWTTIDLETNNKKTDDNKNDLEPKEDKPENNTNKKEQTCWDKIKNTFGNYNMHWIN